MMVLVCGTRGRVVRLRLRTVVEGKEEDGKIWRGENFDL
jgi:hypothetical protein